MYVEHVKAGVTIAHGRPSTLLLFSGGQTREAAGPRSEGRSYFEIARDHRWWSRLAVEPRTFLEEYARDGFENLVFSLARFRELTGNWPGHVVVAGWVFKRQRYETYARLLNCPPDRFEYVGVNQPPSDSLRSAIEGESSRLDWLQHSELADLFEPDDLRRRRDPFSREHPYRDLIADLCREPSA